MSFFEETIGTKIRKADMERIHEILKSDKDNKYENVSHFVRCAVIKLVNEEK